MKPYSTIEVACPHHECEADLQQVEYGSWYCPVENEIIPDSEVDA